MARTAPTLKLVETVDEIRGSVASFVAEAGVAAARKLARGTQYWVHDPSSLAFGPGKFVGFVGVTFHEYEQAKDSNFQGDRFDGHTTRTRIEKVIGAPFAIDAKLAQALELWGVQLWGAEAFHDLDKTKWRFLTLPFLAQRSVSASGSAESGPESTAKTGSARAVGGPYRPANEDPSLAVRDPFEVDPEKIDRGTRGHATTQNALAEFLRSQGTEPLSPVGDPQFDLAWVADGALYVAEVKSVTDANEEKQLRLGLGQVLRYRHVLAENGREVVAVLAAERKPSDPSWVNTCAELGVVLVWPGTFDTLVSTLQRSGTTEQ